MMASKNYVYILQSKLNRKYYIGCTKDIGRRVEQHNSGFSKYTKNRGPWELVYKEIYSSLSEARHREKQIKSWKKRAAIEKLILAPIV